MMSPKQKKTVSAVIVIALVAAMVLTMVLPYILLWTQNDGETAQRAVSLYL